MGTPDTFSDTFANEIGNWDDLMAVQRVSDVSFVIPHNIICCAFLLLRFIIYIFVF